jgi:hypothetical protein
VGFVDAAEAPEGGEELVVSTGAGGGDKAAHGERVDEGVVEMLIFEGLRSADVTFATDWLRGQTARRAYVFDETKSGGADAEEIGGAVLDEGFGIDGTDEMRVQVGTFGHAGKKGVELERTLLCGTEGLDGALLVRGRRWCMCNVPGREWLCCLR